jgi:xylose isomerase
MREERYAGWAGELGTAILSGGATLLELERRVSTGAIDPQPVSGRQEILENLVNQQIWAQGTGSSTDTAAGR